MQFNCSQCQNPYPKIEMPYLCPLCGHPFLPDHKIEITREKLLNSDFKIPYWRFSNVFGLFKGAEPIYLGEGQTPVINYYDQNHKQVIKLKLESHNPTGSYKDRNSALLVSQMKARDIREFLEDSSGNAGASISAYAAKVNMTAQIYAPTYASGAKKKQIEAFGAKLNLIKGSRQAATDALLTKVEYGAVYASHAWMPFGIPGIATIAFELVEEFGDEISSIIIPTGHGGLLYGIVWGFQLMLYNMIISKLPVFYGIQSEMCDPLTASKIANYETLAEVEQKKSIAEGIMITKPSKAIPLLKMAQEDILKFISVSDDSVKKAIMSLNEQGINVENTSGVVIAALEKINLNPNGVNIAVISGHGLKTI